ncbi:MAG: hypothetical protein K2H86_01080 [Muribaculaceae bacterium]|nr:hypothetical protein [Muribaculaceae bacterium]
MERIRSNAERYKIGEASGITEGDARKASLENLMMQLRTTFSLDFSESENVNGSEYDYKNQSDLKASSIMTVENLSTISFQDDNGWHAMSYISNIDLAAAETMRRDNIKDLILLGIEQEGRLNIAGALKYYTWALNMLSSFGDNLIMEIEGKNRTAKPWLIKHIPMILDNIDISINDNSIDYDEFDYDHYSINLDVKYAGQPVCALDLSYFNGEREIKPVHSKNGIATLSFPDIKNFRELNIKVVFDYPEDAKLYGPELKTIYEAGRKVEFDGHDNIRIPIKINANNIKTGKTAKNDRSNQNNKAISNNTGNKAEENDTQTNPIIDNKYKQIERPIENNEQAVLAIKNVETALRNRKYESVKNLFTEDGWKIFSLLTSRGDVKVTGKTDNIVIESSNLFTIGKGIPISFKTYGHVANETLVFRFDKSSGLISSIAFALTKRAEEDIFRQAMWNIDSRYSLLTFMEDYQTAFALKRLDYIQKIFSDDAVIITGKIEANNNTKKFFDIKSVGINTGDKNVTYRKFNKDQYIDQLKSDFFDKKSSTYKKYIQLTFEDAVISKVAANGYTDNEVMWIEIKQQYNSDKYSDKGYLSLQIDLKPKGSQIHVRTWTPEFIDIDFLKEHFGIGEQ